MVNATFIEIATFRFAHIAMTRPFLLLRAILQLILLFFAQFCVGWFKSHSDGTNKNDSWLRLKYLTQIFHFCVRIRTELIYKTIQYIH